MEKAITILLSFLLTAVIGNGIARRWQNRQWVNQQRVLGFEKEFVALKEVVDELSRLLGARIYHTQRLTLSLRSNDQESFSRRIGDYEDAVKDWNEKLGSFYVRLPFLAGNELGIDLERSIQDRLVYASRELDKLLELRRSGDCPQSEIHSLMNQLNSIQGRAIAFNKQLLGILAARRERIYVGKRIAYRRERLAEYSNWELVQAIFIANVDSHSVLRSPLDS